MNIHPSPTHRACMYFTWAMLCLGCNIQVLAAETQAVNGQAIAVTGELSLLQAEQRFVLYNRSVLAARRDVEAAEADRLIAGQRPNPQLSIGFSSVNLNRGQGNLNQNGSTAWIDKTYNSSVQINQLIERGGKQALRTAVADGGLLASKLDLRETLRQQRLSMLAAYYDLKLAQDIQGLLTEQQSLSQHILQAAELRLRAGDIAPAEVMRLRVDVLRVENELRQSQANLQKAQTMLAYQLGLEAQAAQLHVTDPWPVLRRLEEIPVSPAAWSQRPDILAAEARVKQAESARQLAESLQTRDVTLGIGYQHFPGQEPGAGANTVGASLTIPLLTNYQYQGEAARAEVDLVATREAKESRMALASVEWQQAQAGLAAAIDKSIRFETEILQNARQAADAAAFAFQHGAAAVTELLDARRVLRALEMEALNNRADYAKSLAVWQSLSMPVPGDDIDSSAADAAESPMP